MQRNTHFPQVPVKIVKQIAEEDGTVEHSKHGDSQQPGHAENHRSQNDPAEVQGEKDAGKDP